VLAVRRWIGDQTDRLAGQEIHPQGPAAAGPSGSAPGTHTLTAAAATRRPPPRPRPRHRGWVRPNRARSGSTGEYGAKFSIRADFPRSEYVWRRSVKPPPQPCRQPLLGRASQLPFRAGRGRTGMGTLISYTGRGGDHAAWDRRSGRLASAHGGLGCSSVCSRDAVDRASGARRGRRLGSLGRVDAGLHGFAGPSWTPAA
jgi:hypothetical protein